MSETTAPTTTGEGGPAAEDALRASEARFRALATASAVAIYRMSPDWSEMRQLDGRGFLADTSAPSEDWLGRYVPPDDQARVTAAVAAAVRAKGTFELEHRVIRADGTLGWTSSRAVPMLDDGGAVVEWIGAASDVTARRQADDVLRASEARYRALFESIDEGFCVIEVLFDDGAPGGPRPVDFRFREANPAFIQQTGLTDVIGRTGRELVPTHEPHWLEICGRVALTGEPTRFEAPAAALGRWYDLYAFRVGMPCERRVAVLFDDISARKRAEAERERLAAAVAAERERLEALVLHMPAPVALLLGPEHRHALVNAEFRRISGGGRDVTGLTVREAFPELAGQGIYERLDRVYATGEPWAGPESPVRYDRDGTGVIDTWFDVRFVPVRDADGRVVGILNFAIDVTAQVVARRESARLLAASEGARAEAEAARADGERARERTALLQRLTATLSTASTPEQIAEAVVRHATRVVGAVGTVIARLTPDGEQLEIMRAGDMPDDIRDDWRRFPVSAPVPLAEAARTARPIFLESRAAWGARYPAMGPLLEATGHHANAVVPLVVDGRVLGVLGAAFGAPRAFDADDRALALAVAQQCAQALERARLLEQAQAANRAKSEFLAVMSHELRTPLNAIGGYAELMELGIRGPLTAQQREDLRRLQANQRHLLGLINEVLNYAKLETGTVHYDLADVPLRDALAQAEALVAPQARAKGLALEVAPCPAGLAARADGEKLRQVLANLLSNAVKFTDRGGRIVLACAADGDRVRVHVRDTGIGIAADKLAMVFEPFVQVRADLTRPHEGTGLGLAISRDLARGMGGDLTVESHVGDGSCFTLTLPSA